MTQNNIRVLRPEATDEEASAHIHGLQIKSELERLNDAAAGIKGIEKVLSAIIASEGSETDWPLRDDDYVKGSLYKALSVLGDRIEDAVVSLERLMRVSPAKTENYT